MITGVDETMSSRKGRVVKVDKLLSLKPFIERRYQTAKLAYQILSKEQTIMRQCKQSK